MARGMFYFLEYIRPKTACNNNMPSFLNMVSPGLDGANRKDLQTQGTYYAQLLPFSFYITYIIKVYYLIKGCFS